MQSRVFLGQLSPAAPPQCPGVLQFFDTGWSPCGVLMDNAVDLLCDDAEVSALSRHISQLPYVRGIAAVPRIHSAAPARLRCSFAPDVPLSSVASGGFLHFAGADLPVDDHATAIDVILAHPRALDRVQVVRGRQLLGSLLLHDVAPLVQTGGGPLVAACGVQAYRDNTLLYPVDDSYEPMSATARRLIDFTRWAAHRKCRFSAAVRRQRARGSSPRASRLAKAHG